MRLNKPSYGVFMVDIFASSVGIFILVSLLYIIESSKATSNEAMVEKFKTLIKRDLVPVDRYSLPVSNDPLHDWGVRARHAREQQEALILLLRDKVLLYHTNQLLNTQQIVDSDIILNYYKKYNKNRRLFIEIHYHDAYHTLKAKIDEALPENVHQWVHWAYNAGNINNPNPVAENANRPNLDMTPNGRDDNPIDPDSLAMPSSLGGGSSARGTSALAGDNQSSNQGEGRSEGQGQGQDQGQNETGSEQGQSQGPSSDASGQDDNQSSQDSQANGALSTQQAQQQAVQQALSQMLTSQDFIEQFMQDSLQSAKTSEGFASQEQTNNLADHTIDGDGNGFGHSQSSKSTNNTTNTNHSNTQAGSPSGTAQNQLSQPQQPAKANELAMDIPSNEQQNALDHIRKNVFLKVPLYSPINDFNVDIKVPGFNQQNIRLDAVTFKLHQSANTQGAFSNIGLQHGDAIIPLTKQLNLINPVDNRGWLAVKIIKVTGQSAAKQGWIYGLIDEQSILLPLYENTVKADGNDNYWYERNNTPLKAFEITPSTQQGEQ